MTEESNPGCNRDTNYKEVQENGGGGCELQLSKFNCPVKVDTF